MRASIVTLAIASGAQLASGHTTVWSIAVNGKDQGVGKNSGGYIDSPPNNNPITDVTSSNMACNVPGVKASKSIPVNGGDEIAFEWHHDTNDAGDDIIATSHHGPIMVYASKAGGSYSWTKLWEETYDGSKWAVDKIIAGSYTGKKGQHKLTLPKLAPGDYILRPEIIALHEGNKQGGAQFYMECVHVTVGGSGTLQLPSNGVSFPGAYKATDPGVLFNIYSSFSSYPAPGPKVWNGASSSGNNGGNSGGSNGGSQPTTMATSVKPAQTAAPAGGVARYGQCGGSGYSGSTACASGLSCTKSNDYYSQCL